MTPRAGLAVVCVLALHPALGAERSEAARGCRYTAPSGLAAATILAVNRVRAAHGLRAFATDRRLACAARRHVRNMRRHGYFAHVGPGNITPALRALRAGYLDGAVSWRVGEVLASLAPRARAVRAVRGWLRSPGHRAEILGSYTSAGAAASRRRGRVLIALDLGRRAG